MKPLLIIVALLCLVAIPAAAQTVTFGWDLHDEAAQLTGFRLYQSKTSGSYGTTPIATFSGGTTVTGSIPKPGLGRYYYVLTAFNAEVESDHSNEVSLVVKPKAPKLNTVQQVAAAVKNAITKLAWWTRKDKDNLRILDE